MKRFFRNPAFYASLLLTAAWLGQPCHARDGFSDADTVIAPGATSAIDPGEEARKILQLVKLALHPNASQAIKNSLADEIALVEKHKKLKENVVAHLLRDDEPDPTSPKVQQVNYKDGTIRGILFTQSDTEKSATPGKLAWALDSKREQKETSR